MLLCFFVTFCPLSSSLAPVAVVYFVRGILLDLLFPRWKTARRVKKESELKAKLYHLFLGLVWDRLGMHPKSLRTFWDGYCWAYCPKDGNCPCEEKVSIELLSWLPVEKYLNEISNTIACGTIKLFYKIDILSVLSCLSVYCGGFAMVFSQIK